MPIAMQRHTALSLAIIFALFSFALVASLVALHVQETRQGVLTETVVPELKTQLNTNPDDVKVKEKIRQVDLQLRDEHLHNRRRFAWAAWMLLASLPLALLFAHLHASLSPEESRPLTRAEAQVRASIRSTNRSRSILGLCAIGGLCITGFVLAGTFMKPVLPSEPKIKTAASRLSLTKAPSKSVNVSGEEDKGVPSQLQKTPLKAVSPDAVWPGFRGASNIGVAGKGPWPTEWSAAVIASDAPSSSPASDKNILWKSEIPISGNSSPVVWADKIFLTGATKQQYSVFCFDTNSGKLLWTTPFSPSPAAAQAEVQEQTGYAAPTPVTDGKNVYALFGTGLLAAIDYQGKVLWKKDLGVPESTYGFASSPLMAEGLLILQYDQGSDAEDGLSEIHAFDPATGTVKWSVPRAVPNSWSSPALIETKSRKEIITCASPLIIAYDPASGKELWSATGLSGDVAPSPAFGGDLVFATGDGAQLMAIRPGGSGDVSATHVAWTSDQGMPDTCSPVSDGKYLLQVGAGGYLTCFNIADGKLLWDQRLESSATASPIVAGGQVYLSCEDGITRIFKLGESNKLASQGDVGEKVNATPAFADSRIYIRGAKHLFCIGEKK